MPSSRRLVLSLSLAGLAALGAYAWYANRPPAVLPGGTQTAGAQGGPPAAVAAGAKAVAGGAGAAPG
ncbi:RND family efflux transporter MFP subunit, partial [Thauera phenylacetica B4P]